MGTESPRRHGRQSPCWLGTCPVLAINRQLPEDENSAEGLEQEKSWGRRDKPHSGQPGSCPGSNCHRHKEKGVPAHPSVPPTALQR